MSAASSQSAAAARTSVSYWSVVGSQLKKNRIAMGAARTVAALVALAVGAPLLAMNAPLVALDETGFHVPLLTPEGMGVHAPLLDTLFNRDMYPSGVDVFFNLLLIVGGMWFVGARVPAALRRLKEEGLRALVKPRSRVADGMALTAAGLLVVLGFLPEGSGGWFVTLLRAVAWITLLPALPWAGPIALIFTGAWIVIAGPAFLGWLLIALAFPTMTGVVLLAYLVFGAATGALLGTWTLAWLLLPGLVGGLVWVYSARRPGEAPGDLRRSERLRWARWISLALFLITFVVLLRSHQTRPVVDWTKTLATTEATGVMPPIPYHPDNVGEQGLGPAERSRQRPSRDHVLGCDLNGRDVAARLIFGTRISLTIGLVAVSLYVTIGVILGSLAGYYGGWVDILISRAVEVMICFPVLFLLLTIVAVFDTRSIFLIMAGIGIVGWPTVARLVRGEFLRQRNLDYVTAAQAQGLPEWRVIFGHVLPNCVGPVLVSATFGIAAAILTESGLAFLGLGDTTAASWGQMLKDGRDSGLWHMIFSPGFAIFFVVTVFNLLGEGLRDALDPKLEIGMAENESDILLSIRDLQTWFFTDAGVVKAVDGVSYDISRGRTLGVVGESGCGKSVTALSIMRLIPDPPGRIVGGEIMFEGQDLTKLPMKEMRDIRGADIGMIFQEPMTSLNPVFTVGYQIMEPAMLHLGVTPDVARSMAIDVLDKVGIPVPEKRINEYPHQLSGGMRQRVMIAMSLVCNPKLLIADEPTTALDVTIQAQILDLMKQLQDDLGMAVLVITHDLGVVAEVAHDVVVMYAGKIVEYADVLTLYEQPRHPYTIGLFHAIPKLGEHQTRLNTIAGEVPNPLEFPSGCKFHPRCPFAFDRCKEEEPPISDLGGSHRAACWMIQEGRTAELDDRKAWEGRP